MLRHQDVWQAIDQLAADHGFSPSGLARRAGLDPTTFNRSKRVARDGRPRWPSTESLAKILEATGASMNELVAYISKVQGTSGIARRVPLLGFTQAGAKGAFDEAGHPSGGGWDELMFPDVADPHAYALEISGDAMQPIYRDGDTLLVSPEAGLRKGDRVVVRTADGEVMAKTLIRRGAKKIELTGLTGQGERSLTVEAVSFVHRIVWASQ
jgi:phage repressor protein C with HTH and peptisase S24 domain